MGKISKYKFKVVKMGCPLLVNRHKIVATDCKISNHFLKELFSLKDIFVLKSYFKYKLFNIKNPANKFKYLESKIMHILIIIHL